MGPLSMLYRTHPHTPAYGKSVKTSRSTFVNAWKKVLIGERQRDHDGAGSRPQGREAVQWEISRGVEFHVRAEFMVQHLFELIRKCTDAW